jgi:hypothetical protein
MMPSYSFPDSPSFESLLVPGDGPARVLPYLKLLNLVGEGATEAMSAVRSAAENSPDPTSEIVALFGSIDWRPHLPAAVAIALGYGGESTLPALWSRFDRGSWVTPQLAVVAFLTDANFEAEARRRILAWITPDSEWLPDAMALERPSRREISAYLRGRRHGRPKALAALLTLCQLLPSPVWLAVAQEHPLTRWLLSADDDRGGEIAQGWLQRFAELTGLSTTTEQRVRS